MKLFFKIFVIIGICWSKTLLPINDFNNEVLEINGKERDYIILRNDEIVYEIEGPKLVVLHFRKPFPIKANFISSMSIKVKLDDTKYIDQSEKHFKSKDTISKKHPAHAYTNPGVLHINIPKGNHKLFINSEEDLLLIRLTTKKKTKRVKSDIYVEDINNNSQMNVKTGKRSIPYSKIDLQNSVHYSIKDNGFLWVYVRAIHHENKSGLYPIILSYNNYDPLSSAQFYPENYIFYSEISLQSEIEGLSSNIGKLRTILFPISKMFVSSEVSIKNLSENMDVLIHGEFILDK